MPAQRLGSSSSLVLISQKSAELELDTPPGMQIVNTEGGIDWQSVSKGQIERSDGNIYTQGKDRTIRIGPGESVYAISKDCGGESLLPVASVRNLLTTLSGPGTAPKTLAEFFPAVLDDLEIELPKKVDSATAAAVLTAIGGISKGRDRVPVLHLVTRDTPPIEGPFRRRIAFIRSSSAQLQLRVPSASSRTPVLEIRGQGDGMVSSGRLAGRSQLIAFAVPAVRITPDLSYAKPVDNNDAFELHDVASGKLEIQSPSPARLSWSIHQADLGGEVKTLRLTLVGRAEATGTDRPITLRLMLDGRPIASKVLDTGGTFELSAEVPTKDRALLLHREMIVSLEAQISSIKSKVATPIGNCLPIQGVQITIDGVASTIKASLGANKLLGLERFPQAFSQGVTVRLQNGEPRTLIGSAQIIGSLWTGRGKTFDPEIRVEQISVRGEVADVHKNNPILNVDKASHMNQISEGVNLDGIGGIRSDVFDDVTLSARSVKGHDELAVALGDKPGQLEDLLAVASFSALNGDLAVVSTGTVKAVWTSKTPETGASIEENKPVITEKKGLSRFSSLLVGIMMSLALLLALITIRTVLKASRHIFRRPRRTQT